MASRDGTTVGLPSLTCRLNGCTAAYAICNVTTGECESFEMSDGIDRIRTGDYAPVKLTTLQRVLRARTKTQEMEDTEAGPRVIASRVSATVDGVVISVAGQLPARVDIAVRRRRSSRRTFDCGGVRRAAVTHAFAIGKIVYVEVECIDGSRWERIAS